MPSPQPSSSSWMKDHQLPLEIFFSFESDSKRRRIKENITPNRTQHFATAKRKRDADVAVPSKKRKPLADGRLEIPVRTSAEPSLRSADIASGRRRLVLHDITVSHGNNYPPATLVPPTGHSSSAVDLLHNKERQKAAPHITDVTDEDNLSSLTETAVAGSPGPGPQCGHSNNLPLPVPSHPIPFHAGACAIPTPPSTIPLTSRASADLRGVVGDITPESPLVTVMADQRNYPTPITGRVQRAYSKPTLSLNHGDTVGLKNGRSARSHHVSYPTPGTSRIPRVKSKFPLKLDIARTLFPDALPHNTAASIVSDVFADTLSTSRPIHPDSPPLSPLPEPILGLSPRASPSDPEIPSSQSQYVIPPVRSPSERHGRGPAFAPSLELPDPCGEVICFPDDAIPTSQSDEIDFSQFVSKQEPKLWQNKFFLCSSTLISPQRDHSPKSWSPMTAQSSPAVSSSPLQKKLQASTSHSSSPFFSLSSLREFGDRFIVEPGWFKHTKLDPEDSTVAEDDPSQSDGSSLWGAREIDAQDSTDNVHDATVMNAEAARRASFETLPPHVTDAQTLRTTTTQLCSKQIGDTQSSATQLDSQYSAYIRITQQPPREMFSKSVQLLNTQSSATQPDSDDGMFTRLTPRKRPHVSSPRRRRAIAPSIPYPPPMFHPRNEEGCFIVPDSEDEDVLIPADAQPTGSLRSLCVSASVHHDIDYPQSSVTELDCAADDARPEDHALSQASSSGSCSQGSLPSVVKDFLNMCEGDGSLPDDFPH